MSTPTAERTTEADWHSANGDEIQPGWLADIRYCTYHVTHITKEADAEHSYVWFVHLTVDRDAAPVTSVCLLGSEDTLMATPPFEGCEYLRLG